MIRAAHAPDGSGAGTLRAALVAFLPLALAAALTWVAGSGDATSFDDTVLLPPDDISMGRFFLALIVLAFGYFGVYFAPGLLLMRALGWRVGNPVGNAVAAFVLSLFGGSLAWIGAQAVTDGLAGRTCLYLTIASLDAAALLAAVFLARGAPALPTLPAEARGRGRRELVVPMLGVLFVLVAGAFLMPGKITTEALEGDATEVNGFAASLFDRALPYWDLESGVWGFYPTFMFVAYPVFFSLALLGQSEAAVRLPALLFLGVLALATADLAARGRTRAAADSFAVLVPVLVAAYLSMQVGAYYAGYHPFHGDLACSPLEEWMVTALAMCAVVLVRDGAPGLAAVAALLSILTFPSGLMVVGFLGVAGFVTATNAEERWTVFRWGTGLAALLGGWAAFLLVYTLAQGTFGPMIGEWYAKYFQGRASFGGENPERIVRALGWYTLLAGGLPVVGLVVAIWRGDRVGRWLALAGGAWVAFFLFSPAKNIHYFMPAALLPVATALRTTTSERKPRSSLAVAGLLSVSAIVCVMLCRPQSVPPYTADREFGRRTVFLAGTVRQAVDYSKVIFNLTEPLWRWRPGSPWTVGHHTWVLYADRGFDLDREYDFYIGEGPTPAPGLEEVTRISVPGGGSAALWARGGRAAIREWKAKTFPLRKELSRFNFDMALSEPAP
jgi:hypothetical protein